MILLIKFNDLNNILYSGRINIGGIYQFNSIQVKGDNTTKKLLSIDLMNNFIINILIAYTDPIIRIYMVSNIDSLYFKISLLIRFIIGILVNLNFNKDNI